MGNTAFKTLHELDSVRGIFNCCSLSFTDVFQYYDVKQATQFFKFLIFTGMNQNLTEIDRELNRLISYEFWYTKPVTLNALHLHHPPCVR
nr:MAG TPA: hypothetical protein [Caudoviricetes sp.]